MPLSRPSMIIAIVSLSLAALPVPAMAAAPSSASWAALSALSTSADIDPCRPTGGRAIAATGVDDGIGCCPDQTALTGHDSKFGELGGGQCRASWLHDAILPIGMIIATGILAIILASEPGEGDSTFPHPVSPS